MPKYYDPYHGTFDPYMHRMFNDYHRMRYWRGGYRMGLFKGLVLLAVGVFIGRKTRNCEMDKLHEEHWKKFHDCVSQYKKPNPLPAPTGGDPKDAPSGPSPTTN